MTAGPNPLPYASRDAVLTRPRETDWKLLAAVVAVVVIPLIVLCQFIAVWRVDVVDDQMFAYYGWRIAHGATVYLDVWDNKPPGIYWINAVSMLISGDSYAGIVSLCVVALVVAHACFFSICASIYFRSATAVGTILLSFYLMHGYYTGGTNRTETFLVAFELAGGALYFRGWANDRWWKWLAAGGCCGFAFLFKQVGLAGWGAMFVHLLVCAVFREISWGNAVRRGVLLFVGVGIVVAAACAYLASQGALADAYFATFTFNRGYFKVGHSQFPYSYASYYLLSQHLLPILTLPFLLAAAAIIHSVLWRIRPALRPTEITEQLRRLEPAVPRYMLFFSIWWLVAFYGAVMSPNAFRHYLVPTIPPLLLMGTYILSMMVTEQRLLSRLQQRAWVTLAFVAMGWFAIGAVQEQWAEFSKVYVYRILMNDPASWEPVADSVAKITGPDDKIQCWGYQPGVYLRARRVNTCRFTTTEKVGQVGANARFVLDELDRKLRAEPPAAIAMGANDWEWLHNRAKGMPPSDLDLGSWLDEHYKIVDDIVQFNAYVLERRDRLPPGQ